MYDDDDKNYINDNNDNGNDKGATNELKVKGWKERRGRVR